MNCRSSLQLPYSVLSIISIRYDAVNAPTVDDLYYTVRFLSFQSILNHDNVR